MCHLDYLTKCHKKYLVTLASVGGSTPQPPAGYGAAVEQSIRTIKTPITRYYITRQAADRCRDSL